MSDIMPCPYHDCQPEYRKDVFVVGHDDVPEQCWHYWYCPECKKCNPTPKKFNAFGYGFTSQTSKAAAQANWNKAVHRRQLRLLKNAIRAGS